MYWRNIMFSDIISFSVTKGENLVYSKFDDYTKCQFVQQCVTGTCWKFKKSKSQEIYLNLTFVADIHRYRYIETLGLMGKLNWFNLKLYMPVYWFLLSRGHGFELWIHHVSFRQKQFVCFFFDFKIIQNQSGEMIYILFGHCVLLKIPEHVWACPRDNI